MVFQLGSLSGSQNKVPRMDLAFAKRLADGYSSEALVGGSKPLLSASIDLIAGQQHYDLNGLLSSSGAVIPPNAKAEIRQIFHFDPVAAYRFFDTSSALNYLNNQFQFESFSPETIFYVLPIWEDVLRAQQLSLNQKVRRSNFSYNVVNNMLTLYPTPTNTNKLHFTYYLQGTATGASSVFDDNNPFTNGTANLSNIPFGALPYSQINSIGKQWIRKMALSFIKQTLGYVRRKVSDIPIPNGNLVLDGPALVQEGLQEQEQLRNELKDWLDQFTYQKLTQMEMEQADALQRILNKVPNSIFVG